MPAATITSKGQTTIPKEIRDHLHLKPGDRLDFVVAEDGRVSIEPATIDVSELRGILRRTGMKALSDAEIKEAVRRRFRSRK
ncbi:MAG TPA: AbrB/MazE/SpoVT family DNA-binding domain-containing protein [Dissulfurispiraceae bacterium]|nr:AbrB/MazE/SpoVT family DNA-binding domain-containing protein [Dissulfurispiraceae bacterium]